MVYNSFLNFNYHNCMKPIFIFLLFLISSFNFAQIELKGTVSDVNNIPLPNVAIYVNGTTIGTTSDFDGKFSLVLPSQLNTYVVISYIGYKPQYFSIEDKSFELDIILIDDRIELKEVTMKKGLFSRQEMLALFKEYFLGKTEAGLNCTILNEDDIYFKYDEDYYILNAFSETPLLIENNYLGYKIEYTLLKFECVLNRLSINSDNVSSSFFGGTSNFVDVDSSIEKLTRRENSYKGSTLHLFRNLKQNKWSKEEFLLFGEAFILEPKDYFQVSNNKVTVKEYKKDPSKKKHVATFTVMYNKKQFSKLTFLTNSFTIDSFGLFSDYDKIYFSGDLSNKKIGDMLPSNFGL